MTLFSQQPTDQDIQDNRLFLGFVPPKTLRLIIGVMGLALPAILVAGNNFTVRPSISSYYYTPMRWVFVGYFVALGWLLIAYRGFPGSYDDVASVIAGIASIGLAVARTSPLGTTRDPIGWLHLFFVVVFFIVLTYMSGWLFTLNPQGRWKKRAYKLLTFVMMLAIAGLLLSDVAGVVLFPNPVFWFEVLAFEAFGLAWTIKSL